MERGISRAQLLDFDDGTLRVTKLHGTHLTPMAMANEVITAGLAGLLSVPCPTTQPVIVPPDLIDRQSELDVARLLQDTAPIASLSTPTAATHPLPAAGHSSNTPPEGPESPPNPTGTAGYSGRQTLTIRVSGDDDQLSSVWFDIEAWRSNELEVFVDD